MSTRFFCTLALINLFINIRKIILKFGFSSIFCSKQDSFFAGGSGILIRQTLVLKRLTKGPMGKYENMNDLNHDNELLMLFNPGYISLLDFFSLSFFLSVHIGYLFNRCPTMWGLLKKSLLNVNIINVSNVIQKQGRFFLTAISLILSKFL